MSWRARRNGTKSARRVAHERGYRLVFWTDSDSLFTRCGQSIEAAVGLATQPHADFFFTGDHNYALNSGQFLVRNTPWASAFLERWWAAGDDPTFLHSSCHDHLDNGGGIFALFALVAGREHCGDGHRLSRHDRKACEAECNQLMRGRYVTTADMQYAGTRPSTARRAQISRYCRRRRSTRITSGATATDGGRATFACTFRQPEGEGWSAVAADQLALAPLLMC